MPEQFFPLASRVAFHTTEGTWDVGNHGVAPDIKVEYDPQLEKAVQVVLDELKKNPPPTPHRPAFPNYNKEQ